MEPTPVNVTVPANAGPAPFTSVAHLRRSAKHKNESVVSYRFRDILWSMKQNIAIVYIPPHLSEETVLRILHRIKSQSDAHIELEKTTEKEKEYMVEFYDSENTRPLREADAVDVANANLSAIQSTVDRIRNENHRAEPVVTDNFVQCHSRGGAALCATARNV
mgnify:CR=1 FL=1